METGCTSCTRLSLPCKYSLCFPPFLFSPKFIFVNILISKNHLLQNFSFSSFPSTKIRTSPTTFILIDTGLPHFAQSLAKACKSIIPSSATITYILITHGHIDHTGGISTILELYPNVKISFGDEESPFLCNGKLYRHCQGDTWTFNLCKYLTQESYLMIPHEKTIPLSHCLKDPLFYPFIQPISTPGHTPGSTSYLHIPSSSLLVGDALMNCDSTFGFSLFNSDNNDGNNDGDSDGNGTSSIGNTVSWNHGIISNPFSMSTVNWTLAKESIHRISKLKNVKMIWCSHDVNHGIPIENLIDFL